MANITFYLLSQDSPQQVNQLACFLAARHHRQRQRVFILAADQSMAEAVDEQLWQLPENSFVPHNLYGEGPPNGAPVQIGWQPQQANNCAVLINLSDSCPANRQRFRLIYDFVPAEEQLKQSARDRYKQYRAEGHHLQTLAATELLESDNG